MSELIQALVAGGMSAQAAARVAKAVEQTARPESPAAFIRSPGTGFRELYSDSSSYALYVSCLGTGYSKEDNTFGPGGAAFGVGGLAVFDGQILVGNVLYSNGIDNVGDIRTTGELQCDKASLKTKIEVLNTASISSAGATFQSPVNAKNGMAVDGFARLNGQNDLNGPVNIAGPVTWKKVVRDPATVTVLESLQPAFGGKILVGAKKVAALNDFGREKSRVLEITATTSVVTYVTGATFDEENCAITTSSTTATVITGVELKMSDL